VKVLGRCWYTVKRHAYTPYGGCPSNQPPIRLRNLLCTGISFILTTMYPSIRPYADAGIQLSNAIPMPMLCCKVDWVIREEISFVPLYHEGFTTSTLFLYVWISKHKSLVELILHPVHLAPNNAEECLAIY